MKRHSVKAWPIRATILLLSTITALFVLPALFAGCNDYPVQLIKSQAYTEVTERIKQLGTKKVDILFVVDNSQSMGDEQKRLSRNFGEFIKALAESKDGIEDYHIAVITTDMDSLSEKGKFQGQNLKVIKPIEQGLTRSQVISNFRTNIEVGDQGTSYEKGLDAMRQALSPELLKGPNKGFLRKDAVLAIIFVADEDDCSHTKKNGKGIKETQYTSEVCRVSSGTVVLNDNGQPELDNLTGKPLFGKMNYLTPVKTYIDFLKKLKPPGQLIVAGLIGNPVVLNPSDPTKTIPPGGTCSNKVECTVGASQHKCIHASDKKEDKRCGGCFFKDALGGADARPGYRYFEVIKEFGGTTNWFPICGDEKGFKEALLRFAGLILDIVDIVKLSKPPSSSQAIQVKVVGKDGNATTIQPAAKINPPQACTKGGCKENQICGADSFCYGDGWVYFPPIGPKQAEIRLSGTAKEAAAADTELQVVYITK